MLKNLLTAAVLCFSAMSAAYAADVNTATRDGLQTVKGIGPAKADAIILEREKNGPFTDAQSLANRVKGIGEKSVKTLVDGGLTFGNPS